MAATVHPMPRSLPWPSSRPLCRHRAPSRAVPAATYRRRRLVVAVLVVVVLLTAGMLLDGLGRGPLPTAEPASPVLVASEVHVVQPGDTLWSIARRLDPDADPRIVVDRLIRQRGATQLQVGERIVLP